MRTCTSAYAFFVESVVYISTGVVSTMHLQVCTLDRCCEHQRTQLLTHSLLQCAYSLMYLQLGHLALEERGWGGSASL